VFAAANTLPICVSARHGELQAQRSIGQSDYLRGSRYGVVNVLSPPYLVPELFVATIRK
jgi:hypothetical protein